MPPLRRPERTQTVVLAPRRAVVAGEAEVLVVGGGPAGLGAAVGAASAGADVVLVERYGFLGGNATAALVMPLMSFHNQARAASEDIEAGIRLLPTDHGPGEPVIAGVLELFLRQLYETGGAIPPSPATGYTVPFDPEQYKLVALELLDQAGVRFLLHALASGVIGDSEPEGVVFETKSGPLVIRAQMIVDCTGDADVATAAGARFEIGREQDQLVQPMTLMFRMAGFDRGSFGAYVHQHPDQWRGVLGLWDLIREAQQAGELELPREELLFFATPHEHEVSVNSTRVTEVLGTDAWQLTQAEWIAHRQMQHIARFLRARVPGFADSYIAQSGTTIGVRETRRIVGAYQLTAKDVLACRRFHDAIARGSYPIDIHDPKGKGTVLRRLPAGQAYDIPLRCLIPQEIERIVLAGRCISGTHEAHSSYRVTPIAMATGHAAGICAAIAAATNQRPRNVDHRAVQEELIRQGANLRPDIPALPKRTSPYNSSNHRPSVNLDKPRLNPH